MAKTIKTLAVLFTICTIVCVVVYQCYKTSFVLTMGITFGTFTYHFLMRLVVGTIVDGIFKNRIDYTKWWFRPHRFEKKLYQFLRVKKWKKYIPTYDQKTFSSKEHTLEEIAQATCQSELVHEWIVLFSFVPLLFAIPFGSFFVFFFTSLLAACFDSTFVIVQRYNRTRILSLLRRK